MKHKKYLVLALAGIMASAMCGCGSNSNANSSVAGSNTSSSEEPSFDGKTEIATEDHYVENTLHKVNVTASNKAFVTNGQTEYKIVIRDTARNKKAAEFLQKYVEKGTGALLEIVTFDSEMTWNTNEKWIVIDVPVLFNAANLVMPTENIGATGYYIKTVGDTVFIAMNTDRGAQHGVNSFLKNVLGFEMYSSDSIVYQNQGEMMPVMEIVEKPDFEFTLPYNALDEDESYAFGYGTWDIFVHGCCRGDGHTASGCSYGGGSWHNSMAYLPKSLYGEHTEWYAEGISKEEICYTAHGDAEEYALMVQALADGVIASAEAQPEFPAITISVMDHMYICKCDACKDMAEAYGGSNAAALIKLCNAVNKVVQKHFEDVAAENNTEKRELDILAFAYRGMETPPVKKNANGEWEAYDSTVKLDENVGVFLAPITAKYSSTFYEEDNQKTKDVIEGWSAIANDKLYMWTYGTNFHLYNFPLNNYDTIFENMRFCKENGSRFMYFQGQGANVGATHFTQLRSYIGAKSQFNVNLNYNELVDNFFENYFYDAAAPMRQFFEELQAHLEYLEMQYPYDVTGDIYDELQMEMLWPKGLLDQWLKYIDEAYEIAEKYAQTDTLKYETMKAHIKIESMFPRYAIIQLHAGKLTEENLYAMKVAFKTDASEVGITQHWEGKSIANLYTEWGV